MIRSLAGFPIRLLQPEHGLNGTVSLLVIKARLGILEMLRGWPNPFGNRKQLFTRWTRAFYLFPSAQDNKCVRRKFPSFTDDHQTQSQLMLHANETPTFVFGGTRKEQSGGV